MALPFVCHRAETSLPPIPARSWYPLIRQNILSVEPIRSRTLGKISFVDLDQELGHGLFAGRRAKHGQGSSPVEPAHRSS